ncbi:MAG TPA: hypothetical protein VEC99_09375 [Clostridia bacterium]|nr:hypothetical protein [Clostridia bacterium]
MIQTRKTSVRSEYRLLQTQRINDSASLAKKFPNLKALTVNLEYYDSTGLRRNGGMKYKVNLENAKSLFCFNCPSAECSGGDYDLSDELSRAVSDRTKNVIGEMRCQGVKHKLERKDSVPCQNLLRYKLSLVYS